MNRNLSVRCAIKQPRGTKLATFVSNLLNMQRGLWVQIIVGEKKKRRGEPLAGFFLRSAALAKYNRLQEAEGQSTPVWQRFMAVKQE